MLLQGLVGSAEQFLVKTERPQSFLGRPKFLSECFAQAVHIPPQKWG